MCICDLKINEEKIIIDGCWNSLYMQREKLAYYITAKADGSVSMYIKYCPKCGRKLEDEE